MSEQQQIDELYDVLRCQDCDFVAISLNTSNAAIQKAEEHMMKTGHIVV